MKIIKQVVVVFICIIFMLIGLPQVFADDYMTTGFEYEGHTYAIYNLDYTREQARDFCENVGGHIVAINSYEENKAIFKVFAQDSTDIDRAWLGGCCTDGEWYWDGGETFDYANMHTEPTDEFYEKYIAFEKQLEGKWAFASDDDTMPFICEWDFKMPLKFTRYELKGSAKYYPNEDMYQLTGLCYWDFGGVWLNDYVDSDFKISFDYKTGGGTNDAFGGADGFVFAFYADSNYVPELGEELGFGGCGGYGIEFDSFTNENDSLNPHIALIDNDDSNHLISVDNNTIEDNEWHRADISVSSTDITVAVDGEVVLTWSGKLEINNFNLGFAATTGAGMNNHYIKNIEYKRGTDKYSRSTSVGAPIINDGTAKYNENTYNIFEQAISIEKDSKTKIDVAAYVNPNGCEDVHIYLTQDAAHEVELTNSKQSTIIPADIFSPGKDIYILAVDNQTGKSTSLKTKLKVCDRSNGEMFPDSDVDGLNFKLFKETGLTIPDSVAVFGGTEIKWDFGFLPLSVEYDREDSNKVNIVFGTNIETFDGEESKYFKDFDFDEYKEDIKKSIEKGDKSLKDLKKDFMLSDELKMNLFGGKVIGGGSGSKSFESNILGYAEMKVIDGELKFVEGQICLELEVSCTYEGQLFIWVVPVYYEIGFGMGAEFEGKMINIDPESFAPIFEAYVGANVSAKIGGGIGVAKVATVGASGEGSLNIKTAMHIEYLKAWAEGEADFNVKILGKKVASKPFAKGEFLIYETGNPNGLIGDNAVELTSVQNDALYSNIDINTVYPNENRDYLKNPSKWLGDKQTVSLLNEEEASNRTVTNLAQNIYTESAPIIANVDGRMILITLWDNDKRSDINKTMLVYSVYDDWEGTWSEPVAVHDDGTGDYYPYFFDGLLVWHNSKAELNDDMTLKEIASQAEIFVTQWNGEGFDEPVQLTDNNTLDTIPVACRSNDGITVVWVNNSENDILGITGKNSLVCKKIDNEIWEWCDQTTIKEDAGNIVNCDAVFFDEKLYIAYEIDADGNADTINDREIYLNCDGVETQITNNDVIDSNPVFGYDKLFYYSQGNISYISLNDMSKATIFTESKQGLTDDFNICKNTYGENAVIWASTSEDDYVLYASICDNDIWTDAIEITKSQNLIKYPSVWASDWNEVYVAYNGAVDGNNTQQNNLYTVNIEKNYDVEISDAYIDPETMVIYTSITNCGEYNYQGISLYCTDNVAFYENFYWDDIVLLAGETKTFEIQYKRDETQIYDSNSSIEITVDDGIVHNNSFEIAVDMCDLSVKKIEYFETLPVSSVAVTVANEGMCDAENVTINICDSEVGGNIIASKTVALIKSGKSLCVSIEYDATAYENTVWYVQVETENKESYLANNTGYFVNEVAKYDGGLSMNILNFNFSQNKLAVNAFCNNNTQQQLLGNALFALYNEDGILKGVINQPLNVDKFSDTAVDVWFENYEYQKGDYVKIILVEDIKSLKPLIKYASGEVVCR